MFAKIGPNAVPEAIAHIEEVHNTFSPEFPFTYHFLDEDFERLYQSQQHFGLILRSFAILAIIISCLGLFGLASFMAERRTQEIGIRKVLGASIPGILFLLTREFVKWVAIANIIAWPAAWIFSTGWLQNFAYRIDPVWDIYIYTALATLGIALLTVCYQAFRAARANPVESLRYE